MAAHRDVAKAQTGRLKVGVLDMEDLRHALIVVGGIHAGTCWCAKKGKLGTGNCT